MPEYTYTGADERYYPSLGIEAVPGLVADLDAPAPEPEDGEDAAEPVPGARTVPQDGRWELVEAPAAPPAKKPTKTAAKTADADEKGSA